MRACVEKVTSWAGPIPYSSTKYASRVYIIVQTVLLKTQTHKKAKISLSKQILFDSLNNNSGNTHLLKGAEEKKWRLSNRHNFYVNKTSLTFIK